MNDDVLHDITTWFWRAKPNPTRKDAEIQIGCHFEKIAELCEALGYDDKTQTYGINHDTSLKYKQGRQRDMEQYCNRIALLEALCDQIITAMGAGYMLGFDMKGALLEVMHSNWSKSGDGLPEFGDDGKVIKTDAYTPPDLVPYLRSKRGK